VGHFDQVVGPNISDWAVASPARNSFTSDVAATSFAIDGPGTTVVWTSEENNELTCAVGAIYPRPTLAADAALPTLMLVKFCESPPLPFTGDIEVSGPSGLPACGSYRFRTGVQAQR